MKQFILLLALVFFTSAAEARIVYVKASATGANNGTSWANAYNLMDSAFWPGLIRNNDTIWVANGTYKPATWEGWKIYFDSCNVYGGFSGAETSLSQRNYSGYQTILNGDIGQLGYAGDNAVTCFQLYNDSIVVDTPRLCRRLDGFKIINFNYNGYSAPINGWRAAPVSIFSYYGLATYGTNSIYNCFFVGNSGMGSGAVAILGFVLTTLSNCTFTQNQGALFGGAVFYQTINTSIIRNGTQLLRIEDCSFLKNSAPLGGAIVKYGDIWNEDFDSVSTVDIARCSFVGNSSSHCGGVIYDSASSKIRIYNSLFAGNTAPKGAVWYSPPRDTIAHVSTQPHTLYHCTIAHNRSTSTDTTDYPVTLN
ncbi:MAG: hypothetical protein JST27_12410, partial [Bacteroidetes bacterium]|nr:hypothetical protein [Bacteroidota bacterium]